jgi:uncharacterized SAM-binding protein YcdF (DUF218 family)
MTFPVYATCPLPYAAVGVVVLAGCWRYLPGWLRITGIVVEVLLLVLMMPLGADALARWVQSRAPPASACQAPLPDTIVVLSGGAIRSPGGPEDYAALRPDSMDRLFAGVALWRRTPSARLVLTGGSGRSIPDVLLMANLATQMGVPAKAIEIESRSRNTWENARNVAELSPAVPKRIWLVTSAMHMSRALGAFRAFGFQPCAWSDRSGKMHKGFLLTDLVPRAESVLRSTFALHELIGGWEYAVLEWRHARDAKQGH